jgi:hypothetical protein
MHKYDIWLDLECTRAGAPEVVCTVFGKLNLPVRPIVGESLTLWSGKDAPAHFNIVTVVGIQPVHYVGTTIEDVAHHVRPGQDMAVVSTTIRCRPLQVASVADAQKVFAFLTTQHQFELDTYAGNKLEGS